MAVIIQCPHCQQNLEIDQDPSGMELECPVCRKHFIVSAGAAGEAAEPQQNTLHRQLIGKIGNEALNWVFQARSIPELRQMLTELDQYADEPALKEIRQRFIWQVYHYAASLEAENPDLVMELLDCIPGLPEAGDLRRSIVLRKLQDQQKQNSLKRKRRMITAGGVFIAAAVLVGGILSCRETIGAYLGIASCQLSIGEKLAAAGRKSEAFEWYRKAAERENARGQFLLGECYNSAQGIPLDTTEAVKWYRKAAEQGNADGQVMLGSCYEYGRGVTKDYAEAVRWYRKAAEQGQVIAHLALGICYYWGRGVPKDKAEAAKWFRKAAKDDGPAGKKSREVLRLLEG